ncbi:lysophospholipid acyltransferase family protein [Candidatus Halobeggiatoa sp. HSG11]|nr:lysophospholipid acyltransferase family protein [Candidatus Halobeggiatoa sp. HSG11]
MRALLIKGLLYFLSWLPLNVVHKIAIFLGQQMAKRPKLRITQATSTNISLCFPQLSSTEQDILITQSLIETCKAFSELGILWLWKADKVLKLIATVSNEDCLQQAMQQGKGVILLTPHLGAWEMAGLYASKHYPLTALYRPPKLLGLNKIIHTARERAGGSFVATDKKGVRALLQALHQGEIAGILPDQVPNSGGNFAPFFGIPAYTMSLVARLAQKTNAKVIFTYAERTEQGFHVHFLPAPKNIDSYDLELACTALNQGVEQCLNGCRSQYQWSYKRFKRCPVGEESVYE